MRTRQLEGGEKAAIYNAKAKGEPGPVEALHKRRGTLAVRRYVDPFPVSSRPVPQGPPA